MRSHPFPCLALLACLLTATPWSTTAQAEAPPPSKVADAPIRVGIDLWPGYYPVLIAKQRGLFADRGITVEYVVPENTARMLDDFAAGEVDVVCVAMGDAITLKLKEPTLKVAMISDESAGGDALVALKPLPASLKGLRIGTNLDGFGELFVREFVRQRGSRMTEVLLVQMDAAQAEFALAEGRVDIAHTWEPYVSQAVNLLSAQTVFSSAQTPGLIPDSVVLHGQLLQRPEVAKAFLAAWLEAADWWLRNPEAGNDIAERELLQLPGSISLNGIRLFDAAANRAAFRRGDDLRSLYFAANVYLDYYKAKGKVPSTLQAEDILEPSLLPGADAAP